LSPLPSSYLFTYTTLFRSVPSCWHPKDGLDLHRSLVSRCKPSHHYVSESLVINLVVAHQTNLLECLGQRHCQYDHRSDLKLPIRSEEHTSELQSRFDLVCR